MQVAKRGLWVRGLVNASPGNAFYDETRTQRRLSGENACQRKIHVERLRKEGVFVCFRNRKKVLLLDHSEPGGEGRREDYKPGRGPPCRAMREMVRVWYSIQRAGFEKPGMTWTDLHSYTTLAVWWWRGWRRQECLKENRAVTWVATMTMARRDRVKRFLRQHQQTLVTESTWELWFRKHQDFSMSKWMDGGNICINEETFTYVCFMGSVLHTLHLRCLWDIPGERASRHLDRWVWSSDEKFGMTTSIWVVST